MQGSTSSASPGWQLVQNNLKRIIIHIILVHSYQRTILQNFEWSDVEHIVTVHITLHKVMFFNRTCLCIIIHELFEDNVDFLLDKGLDHNLVSIIPNYNLYNLQKKV